MHIRNKIHKYTQSIRSPSPWWGVRPLPHQAFPYFSGQGCVARDQAIGLFSSPRATQLVSMLGEHSWGAVFRLPSAKVLAWGQGTCGLSPGGAEHSATKVPCFLLPFDGFSTCKISVWLTAARRGRSYPCGVAREGQGPCLGSSAPPPPTREAWHCPTGWVRGAPPSSASATGCGTTTTSSTPPGRRRRSGPSRYAVPAVISLRGGGRGLLPGSREPALFFAESC